MADEYYGTIQDVIEDAQVDPDDYNYETDETTTAEQKLEAKILKYLQEAKSSIDSEASIISARERNFTQELEDDEITAIPTCIHDIANRIAINKIKQSMLDATTPIINKDDYTIQITNDTIMTRAILRDLESCVKALNQKENKPSLGLFRINTTDEDESLDDDINWI